MTIDILLSTYNGAPFVDAQLESLFNQTYRNIKVLIRDDGSKDETPQKLAVWKERYPAQIELLLESNVGVIESFNRVYALSRSPYIAFCDQDDIWLPEKLETCLQLLKDQRGPALVHSDLCVVDRQLQVIDPSFWDYSYLSGEQKYATLSRLLVQNVVTGCTTLFNRELAESAFPVPKEALMHDWWFALVAACFGKVSASKKQLILYRQHGNNTLGAQKFTLLTRPSSNLQRLLKVAKHEKRKVEQAQAFLEQYRDQLSLKKIELLEDFISLRRKGYFQRIGTIIKHGFYKIGWPRNLFYLLKS
jgi:glycosyltransferase involved in cell wall biosynthesis